MRFQVITLFPEMVLQACTHGVLGQAWKEHRLAIETINPREFTSDIHQAVDDRPFGGGDGMVMFPGPLDAALQRAEERLSGGSRPARKLYLSARGRPFSDALARELAHEDELILLCGRYGGVDQRLLEANSFEEITVGDFVLSGGEIGALAVIDATSRFLPGVLGNASSPHEESFAKGLLEHPQFTRPRDWKGWVVPDVLMSGNHARIEAWRLSLAILVTAERRPDLLRARGLSDTEARQSLKALEALTPEERRACGVQDEARIREQIEAARRGRNS